MGIDELLRELREDRVHGASWYFLRGIEVIRSAVEQGLGPDDIRVLLNELRSVRLGMASIINLTDIVDHALGVGLDLNNVIAKLKYWHETSSKHLMTQLDRFPVMCGSKVITISYSSAVNMALSRWSKCIDTLYIMESRPGNEIPQAIKDYSKYVSNIVPIPDSAIAYFMRNVNYVISGADGLYSDGYFINKVGTETLFVIARRFDVNTIVIAESYKAVVGGIEEVYMVDFSIGGLSTQVPLFDKVSLDLISYLITDLKIVKKPKPEDIENLRELFINNILNPSE
ncbi:initiation factor 2B [Vulcanisaeta sp. JCM 16159]|uniref:initiation factor 2B n=1 Tax=Vulcanisaeta sp. JCM 16159 TaxID=1295371 RepID=UPI0006CFDB42|nr:initiation factor 2B [Vulcanisaeta sp. JCM 16159]